MNYCVCVLKYSILQRRSSHNNISTSNGHLAMWEVYFIYTRGTSVYENSPLAGRGVSFLDGF